MKPIENNKPWPTNSIDPICLALLRSISLSHINKHTIRHAVHYRNSPSITMHLQIVLVVITATRTT